MFGKIRRRKADIEYSKWLRAERKQCERCFSTKTLQVSHFYGRANEATRFFPDNTDCFCAGCHAYFTANPNEYAEWKKKQLGEKRYKQLVVAAHTYQKRDDEKVLLFLQIAMKQKPKKEKSEQCVLHKLKMCTICHRKKPVKKKVKSNTINVD